MSTRPVVILGAGATKACGGPLTNEILPRAFRFEDVIQREDFFPILRDFLIENFHLPKHQADREDGHYPALPLLISLLDIAIDRKHNFGRNWSVDRLGEVRNALEYVIFALLEHDLRRLQRNYYLELIGKLFLDHDIEPVIISLNYDIIADNSLMALSERYGNGFAFPDYGCDVATETYRERPKRYGKLYKPHGSLNWLYCPGCNRLDVGLSKSGLRMVKVLNDLYQQESSLEQRYTCHGSPCLDCGTFVRPVMITPTHLKDYRNPHISQVWYRAERALRQADHAVIVGYSLPEDDVDVIYLLKRGLAHLAPPQITVVEYDEDPPLTSREHPTGLRYCTIFGDAINWYTSGLEGYLETL